MDADLFIKDLKREHDLDDFLLHIIQHQPKDIARILTAIALDVWAQVRNLSLKDLDKPHFKNIASSHTHKNAFNYFNRTDFQPFVARTLLSQPPSRSDQPFALFKHSLLVYVSTVLLVVGGFF